MEEEILREILQEIKGLRQDVGATNQGLDTLEKSTRESIGATNQRLDIANARLDTIEKSTREGLEATNQRLDTLEKSTREGLKATNQRLDTLEKSTRESIGATNQRLDKTNERLDGLHQSFVVLQQVLADVRYELKGIKDILAERVIWNNETISIDTTGGTKIHGVIHKGEKK